VIFTPNDDGFGSIAALQKKPWQKLGLVAEDPFSLSSKYHLYFNHGH